MDAVKDEHSERPVASAWRPTFHAVIEAFVQGDYALARGVRSVAPVSAMTAQQIEAYILDYGERLAELPDETWNTSVALWMGTRWEVIVDLWTVESGRSDMVLMADVFEASEGSYRIEIHSVHVP